MSSIYTMSGYENKYGEDIRNRIMNDNKKYINHYNNFQNIKLDLTYGQFSGSVNSKSSYTGEKNTPKDITQTELEKEMEFQGQGKKEYYEKSGGIMNRRRQMPRSRKARNFITKGRRAILETAPEIADALDAPEAVKVGLEGLRTLSRLGSGKDKEVEEVVEVEGSGVSGGKLKRSDIVKKVMKDRGVKMIEASKIVKNEGLYKSGSGRSGGMSKRKKKTAPKKNVSVELDENSKKLSDMLGMSGKGRSGGLKKYKKKELMNNINKLEDNKLKNGIKKHMKGMKYGKGCDICEMNKHLEGKGFWEDFGRGFMSVIKPVASVAKAVLPVVAPGVGTAAALGMNAIGLGKSGGEKKKKEKKGKEDPVIEKLLGGELIMKTNKGSSMSGGGVSGGGVSGGKKKRKTSDKMKKRGELVRKIMKERGVKLAEASRIIKSEGLM